MEKIHALQIAGNMNMGGIESQIMQFVRYASEKVQFDFLVDNDDGYFCHEIKELKGKCIVVNKGLRQYFDLFRLLKKGKYDVVHSHQLHHNGFVLFIAMLAGVPIRISHAHSTRNSNKKNRFILKIYFTVSKWLLLLSATDLVACSKLAGIFLYGRKRVESDRRYKTIHNAIDIDKFVHCYNSADAFRKNESDKYVVHIGRFSEVKNHKLILDIAEQAKIQGSKIHFVLVGDGELKKEIEKQVNERGLSDFVILLGQRNDIPSILHTADMLILPSIYEGMPVTLIEAQATGKYCLISDSISKEVDFELGLISTLSIRSNPSIWLKKILEIMENKANISDDSLVKAAQSKGFTIDSFSENVLLIYNRIATDC